MAKDSAMTDELKYYCLHKSRSHDNNECIYLKDAIEHLIKKRQLTGYTLEGGKRNYWDQKKDHRGQGDSPKKKLSSHLYKASP